MLVVRSGLRLNLSTTLNNPNIVLYDGMIQDKHTNTAYNVVDNIIPKVFNSTMYIYYDISIKDFISVDIEYPSSTLEVLHPNLCPILIATIDSNNITEFSYYQYSDVSGDTIQGQNHLSLSNSTITISEISTIFSDTIFVTKQLLGVINIYIHEYGDVDLTSVIDIDSINNVITLMDDTFGGHNITITYISQRVF